MPITSSAHKALRASKKKRIFNLHRKSEIEKQLKDIRKLITAKNKVEAIKKVPLAYKAFDKAAKTGYIKANTAARLKSRLMKSIARISA